LNKKAKFSVESRTHLYALVVKIPC